MAKLFQRFRYWAARAETNPLRQKNPLRKSASPGEIRFALRNPLRLKLICRKSASPDADWSDADCPDALKIDVLLSFFNVCEYVRCFKSQRTFILARNYKVSAESAKLVILAHLQKCILSKEIQWFGDLCELFFNGKFQ